MIGPTVYIVLPVNKNKYGGIKLAVTFAVLKEILYPLNKTEYSLSLIMSLLQLKLVLKPWS